MWKELFFKGIWFIVGKDGTVKTKAFDVVYSDGRKYHYPEKIVKWYRDRGGYMIAALSRTIDGIRRTVNIKQHRLVAMAFIPNPQKLSEINHKNEDKTDNRVENLEWCSRSYNLEYGTAKERSRKKKMNRGSKMFPARPVLQMDMNGNVLRKYPSIMDACRLTGVEHSCICRACSGVRHTKTAGGYKWSYVEQ